MRKKYKLILKEDLELFEIAVNYVQFFDEAVMEFWKENVDVLRKSAWRNTVNETKNVFFKEAEALDTFFNKEFFIPLKNADIFKLFKQAEHAVWVFKMRGTFSKASKKAIEKIEKISCPMHRMAVEEIVKKAIEKIENQQNVKDEGCKVEKMQEKESIFSLYIEAIKAAKPMIFMCGALLAIMWITFFLNNIK